MSPSEKPKRFSDKLMAPGDGLRQWWDRLSRCHRMDRGDDAVRMLIESRKPMFEFMIRQLLTQ